MDHRRRFGAQKLRQKRGEEDSSLGIEQRDEKSVAENLYARRASRDRLQFLLAAQRAQP
jgi:hypothetical protein